MRNIKRLLLGWALILLGAPIIIGGEDTGKILTVHNKGVGGQNSRQGRKRFARDVLAFKPNYVFIYFGLNDTLNEKKFISEKEYVENLRWMVDQARKAGIKPVLCTIHPIGEDALLKRHKRESYGAEGPNGKIDRYNTALRRLIKEMKVHVADFERLVVATNQQETALVSADGVHLTPFGYRVLADCFFKVVASEIAGKATIVCLGDSVTWGAGVKGAGTTNGETYPAYLSQMPGDGRKNQ